MSQAKFGKTTASSIYQLSDAIWMNEVRSGIKNLVRYISTNETQKITTEIENKQFQKKIFGKPLRTKVQLNKFKQAAIAIARLKYNFPEMIEQLEESGDNVFNIHSKRCIFFKHDERIWHIPGQNQQRNTTVASSFVLFDPSLSRVLSFETREGSFNFEQFRFGNIQNVQLQGAFSKVKGNANRSTKIGTQTCEIMDFKFMFRTIRDTKTIFQARRLENFSFVTTNDAGANSFKTAFFFVTLGIITKYERTSVLSNSPASEKDVILVDDTGEQEFHMFCSISEKESPMSKSILKVFGIDEVSPTDLKKNNHVLAISRWALEDQFPEILYMVNIGKTINESKANYFKMVSYINTRKKIPFQELRENFPEFDDSDENFLHRDEFVYLLQYGWEKNHFMGVLDQYRKIKHTGFLNPDFPIGLFFHVNHDSKKIYFSNSPEETFSTIYNTGLNSWSYKLEHIQVEHGNTEQYVQSIFANSCPKKITIIGQAKPGVIQNIPCSSQIIQKTTRPPIYRDRANIMNAIDLAQTIIRKFSQFFIKDVKISSIKMKIGNGNLDYVSNIKIVVEKN